MRVVHLFLLFIFGVAGAWAQPGKGGDTVQGPGSLDQRRVELRSVLKSQHASGVPGSNPAREAAAPTRYLSDQQRAELRLQLRQNRRDSAATSP